MNDKASGKGDGNAPVMGESLGIAAQDTAKQYVTVDVEKYQAWLDDPDLTDKQKEQIVEALWQIILTFVDLGFGVAPLQDACGQLPENDGVCGKEPQDVVRSNADTLTDKFNEFAAD